jgi:hypothetical protein
MPPIWANSRQLAAFAKREHISESISKHVGSTIGPAVEGDVGREVEVAGLVGMVGAIVVGKGAHCVHDNLQKTNIGIPLMKAFGMQLLGFAKNAHTPGL